MRSLLLFCLIGLGNLSLNGQDTRDTVTRAKAGPGTNSDSLPRQHDLIDLSLLLFHGTYNARSAEPAITSTKAYVTAAPIIEYTIATGFLFGAVGNIAFKRTIDTPTNTSIILAELKYSQKKQILLPLESSYWSKGNKYNFVGDWRFFDYVQDSYGLGGATKAADKYLLTYKYLRISELILKRIKKSIYAGVGYQLDYHWNIVENAVLPGVVTDFQLYGFTPRSVSSGLTEVLVYDSRDNGINPAGGSTYGKLQFIQNTSWLGSTAAFNAVIIDLRKYIAIKKKNVLGFWLYSALTLSGNPPYLDLPGTGTDTYNNLGRGYEQNRYTGKNLIYFESEYRFGITRDGLLGAVLFANLQSVSEPGNDNFKYLLPGGGVGLRLKFNKFSRTNVCIDYGYGIKGSHGFAGNLGEIF